MKTASIVLIILAIVIGLPLMLLVLGVGGLALHGCDRAAGLAHNAIDTAADQIEPRELLRKYVWFKDAAAALDKQHANIEVYAKRFASLKADYEGKPRSAWSREDREQYNIWLSEETGIQAAYNNLAAEYNSAMSQIQFRFCNVGQLPQGATQVLPREYRAYETELR